MRNAVALRHNPRCARHFPRALDNDARGPPSTRRRFAFKFYFPSVLLILSIADLLRCDGLVEQPSTKYMG